MEGRIIHPVPQDMKQVNLNRQAEEEYWMKLFGCSKTQLEGAVHAVGFSPENILAFLTTGTIGKAVTYPTYW